MLPLEEDSAQEAGVMHSEEQRRFPQSDSPFEVASDDSNGESLAARYQVLEELGSGSFGVVYKAIEKATGEIVAIKHVILPETSFYCSG